MQADIAVQWNRIWAVIPVFNNKDTVKAVAVACRHITGLSTIVWGNDYPHAEGTFLHTGEAIDHQFRGVEPADREAILGGTLGRLLGVEAPTAA